MLSRIYLIRHGITEGNLKKWFYGHADISLAEEGKEALRKLAERGIYPPVGDADCYTSGLRRTEETFGILFGNHDHKQLPLLKEMGFGDYECKTYEQIKDSFDFDFWAYDKTGDAKLPGGESKNEFNERIACGFKELMGLHRLKELSHRHSGKDATSILVCHGGVISAIMQQLFPEENNNMWDWIPDPGYGYMIELRGGEPIMYEKIAEIKKLGFGFMRPPMNGQEPDVEQTKKMVDLFMDKGFTYFDTAWGYLGGKSEELIKKTVVDRYPRDKFQLATKLPAWIAKNEEEAKAMFETSLKRTGVDFFDYYLLHNLGANRTKCFDDFHIWDFLAKKKEEGKIVKLGFSIHDNAVELEKVLVAHPEMDFVQLQINYADWESISIESRKCYEVARKYNKPIIIMEPVKGGSLAVLPDRIGNILKAKNAEASLASWAIRYAASLDGVLTVLSGMSSVEQMEDNLETMMDFKPLTEEEREAVEEARIAIENTPQIPCTSCGYCLKGCPMNVEIPGIFKAYNNQVVFENRVGAVGNFAFETRSGGIPSKCIKCGACEEVCPQHIDIMKRLEEAKEMFE